MNKHTEALVAERDSLAARVEELKVDLATQKFFGDLWYFVMDESPLEFEKIVSEYQPAQWLHQAVQLRNAKKNAAGAPQ